MRTLLMIVASLLSSPLASEAAPASTGPRDSSGWCTRPPDPPRPTYSKFFETFANLRKVAPRRKKGIHAHEPSLVHGESLARSASRLSIALVGDKLTMSTYPRSCHETGAGCRPGLEWSTPAVVKYEEKVPAGACISYAFDLGTHRAVGIGTEMWTYELRDDESVVARSRVTAPVLELVDGDRDRMLLQEPGGGLWLATWTKATPTLVRIAGVEGRVRAMSRRQGDAYYMYTDRALYFVDATTFEPRWKIEGEVSGALKQAEPARHFVLVVERGAKSRAVLRMLDGTGTQVRQIVIYEGDDLVAARLERTSVPVSRDENQPLYLVEIATR